MSKAGDSNTIGGISKVDYSADNGWANKYADVKTAFGEDGMFAIAKVNAQIKFSSMSKDLLMLELMSRLSDESIVRFRKGQHTVRFDTDRNGVPMIRLFSGFPDHTVYNFTVLDMLIEIVIGRVVVL